MRKKKKTDKKDSKKLRQDGGHQIYNLMIEFWGTQGFTLP